MSAASYDEMGRGRTEENGALEVSFLGVCNGLWLACPHARRELGAYLDLGLLVTVAVIFKLFFYVVLRPGFFPQERPESTVWVGTRPSASFRSGDICFYHPRSVCSAAWLCPHASS